MKDESIARLRLRRQHLTGTPLPTPEAVVGWLGAVQAQEFAVAKRSIAQRCRGRVTSADLDSALAEGRILRNGQVIGFWRTVSDPEQAIVDIHLTRPLDHTTRSALEKELEQYSRFLQLPILLTKKTVSRRRTQKRQT